MGKTIVIATLALLTIAIDASAGTITNGTWAPANCGSQPVTPAISDKSAEAYNKSLKSLKEWQTKAQAYIDCLLNEANADNKSIVGSANAEQDRYNATVKELNAATAAAKEKLDKE